jgi:uncharacterized membrane protein (UPF0127 family)
MSNIEIETEQQEFEAELADRLVDHFMGMRGRSQGKMFFDFRGTASGRIDMFGVKTDLYLYFIDSEKQVIDIQHAEPWTSDPRTWRFYTPGTDYRYLLESSEELGLEEGDEISFQL